MRLFSSLISEGERIPDVFTCVGDNISPPLEWRDVPDGTKSLVLILSDPDAPGETFYHWAVYNMPPVAGALAQDFPTHVKVGNLRQGVNDFIHTGYDGPCPPEGHGDHRYIFRLLALDVVKLTAPPSSTCKEIERQANEHLIADVTLSAIYSR